MNKMNPDRWQKIERLYNSALDLEPDQRKAFLENACPEDQSIRKEVLRLLQHQEEAEHFIESHAMEVLTGTETKRSPSLLNRKLGTYQIISEIGRGGMGEVYRAKDEKLGREVAIKILPEEFAREADRVARFRREAKLLASLNHPNIAIIYGFEESEGAHFIVLELVEGQTLGDRLKHGPIPIEESLKLAIQIVEALEAAHEKGVIHRDLKPANIKVTPHEKVKVLDFGLAKAFAGDREDRALSDSPTLSMAATQQGMILGTAAYMSPEQARGKPVDKRSDIWAFGAVLFEMLTGHAAFSGEDISDILAAVIRADPDWKNLPANLHVRLREVLERCLEKDARNRYRDIGDVRVDIQRVLADPGGVLAQPSAAAEPQTKPQGMLARIATAVLLTALIVGFIIWHLRAPMPLPITSFSYEIPESQEFADLFERVIAISPDGKQFVYGTSAGLYLRSMDKLNAELIPGTGGNPKRPFFSHDGKWVGYWSETDSQLKKKAISGGASQTITNASSIGNYSWSADDSILYGTQDGNIMRISSNVSTPERVIGGENEPAISPQLLPDGKTVIFTLGRNLPRKIVLQSLESDEHRELLPGTNAQYLQTGHLVYALDSNLYAVPFDLDSLEETGASVLVVKGVYQELGASQYDVSNSGTLIYVPETTSTFVSTPRSLVWVNRNGVEEPLKAPSDYYRGLKISPDGAKVALSIQTLDNVDIWIWDFTQQPRRWTYDKSEDNNPVWSPDGNRIAFSSKRSGMHQIFWKASDGTEDDELLGSVPDRSIYPWSWSSEGKELVFLEYATLGNFDIGVMSIEGNRKNRSLLQRKHNELRPQIAPDGKWMAYVSNESGRQEIWVCPFPDAGMEQQVSTGGGNSPLWSTDGKELFYRNGDSVIAVAVQTDPVFKAGKSKILFQREYVHSDVRSDRVDPNAWDVHPDGRFLMMKEVKSFTSPTGEPRQINIVLNWLEELKQRVPVD